MYRTHVWKGFGLGAAFVFAAVCSLVGCSDGDDGATGATGAPGFSGINDTAGTLVGAADWSLAVKETVQLIELGGGAYELRPANLLFVAGTPVILTIESQAPNVEKHYYTATEFYKSVAWRKAQTVDAEYKAPYFNAFELLIPTSSADTKSIELYFIPVEPGVYLVECTIPGHAAGGMDGTITVIGNSANTVDQEVSSTWDSTLESAPETSGGHSVWDAANVVTQVVDMVETLPTRAFSPLNITLSKDTGYKLTINNPTGNVEKHYYTASAFYETCVTRKAQDSQAEIKVPYFKAVEMRTPAPTSTTLYLVPKTSGTYPVICTVTGHEASGMDGTITVQP